MGEDDPSARPAPGGMVNAYFHLSEARSVQYYYMSKPGMPFGSRELNGMQPGFLPAR